MADRVGQQLGNYRLIRLLGQGGFAEVYLGEQVYLNNQAAIKILYTNLAQEEAARFLAEARTLVRLVHPHIVRLLDFGVEGTTPFLVMDYAPGGTLRQRHPRGEQMPLSTIVVYVNQVADALQYAHNEKLIHRDIKPENMLLGRRNEVLLSDFGIAIIAQSSRYDRTQDTTGTIAYMAPEQIQAHARPASDQYALGVVVYEWLSGDRPFSGTFTEIAAKHVLAPPPPLREKVPTIHPAVEEVVMAALAKDPHQRFASVQAFATALQQASQLTKPQSVLQQWAPPQPSDEPTVLSQAQQSPDLISQPSESFIPTQLITPASQLPIVKEPSPGQVSTPSVMPTPSTQPSFPPTELATPASPATSLPTQLGSTASELAVPAKPSVRRPAEKMSPTQAVQQASVVPQPSQLPSPVTTQPQRGISRRTVVVGLAGLAVVGVAGGLLWLGRPQKSTISAGLSSPTAPPKPVFRPDPPPTLPSIGTTLYTYLGHTNQVYGVAWSPNSKRIASCALDKTVQVWDANDGSHAYVYRGHANDVLALSWSPDGRYIASAGGQAVGNPGDDTVQVWEASSGSRVFTYHGHSDVVAAVAWAPDSRRVASGGADQTVQVWEGTNGGLITTYLGHRTNGPVGVHVVAWSPDGKHIASGAGDQTVQVWDATSGSTIYTYRGHFAAGSFGVEAVAWSPDGSRIASAGFNQGTVQVWDATTGSNVFTYRGHSGDVLTVAWSPDGRRIASGSEDNTVQIWDAADGSHRYTYRRHTSLVKKVAWSPDGKYIASGSFDQTVQVWLVG